MTKAAVPASIEYLYARVHAMRAKTFHGESLHELANADGMDGMAGEMRRHGIVAHNRESFAKAVQIRELEILDKLRLQMPPVLERYYRAFMDRTRYRNIKTLLRYRYFKENEETIRSLIIPMPFGEPVDITRALRVEAVEDFISELHLGEEAPEVEACVRPLMKSKDIIAAESDLERLAYAKLLAAARQLPSVIRTPAVELVQLEIDIQNICMLMRNARTTHWIAERMARLWMPDGRFLSDKLLESLVMAGDVREIIAALPKAYQREFSKVAGHDLPQVEHAAWKMLFALAERIHRGSSDMRMPLVAFPFLLHFESIDLSRLNECVYFGFNPREIADYLFGLTWTDH